MYIYIYIYIYIHMFVKVQYFCPVNYNYCPYVTIFSFLFHWCNPLLNMILIHSKQCDVDKFYLLAC